jgi:hypothetical protein
LHNKRVGGKDDERAEKDDKLSKKRKFYFCVISATVSSTSAEVMCTFYFRELSWFSLDNFVLNFILAQKWDSRRTKKTKKRMRIQN